MAYNSFTLGLKYLSYRLNAKGAHSAHSPFVFDFITKVLQETNPKSDYLLAEAYRKKLLLDSHKITVEDFGAGSRIMKSPLRKISDITRYNAKSAKYAQLMYRMVQSYSFENILELGTSVGITTYYMSIANSKAQIITIEGSQEIYSFAKQQFKDLHCTNIQSNLGEFDTVLDQLIPPTNPFDLVFVDGNHQKESTLRYFHKIIPHLTKNGIFIFDDIHWSKPMEEAWEEVKNDPRVTITIDLFFMGIVSINPSLSKEDFILKF